MSRTFSSLQYPNYRLWFASNIVASTGTWMQRVAQSWLVLTVLTDNSATALGYTTALQFLPILILSPYAGVIADRANLRRLLQITQLSSAFFTLILGILAVGGWAQLWHVYVIAFVSGCVGAIDSPARQTFVSELVPPKTLPNAVGLNSAAFNVARLLGPAMSGLVIAWVGPGWVFIINALLFLVPVVAVAVMKTDRFFPMEHVTRERGQIAEGFRYVLARTDIVVILIVMGLTSAFSMNFQMTSALMATEVFGKGAGEYGILGSFMAVGALTGALLAARRQYPRVRLVVGASLIFGFCNLALAFSPAYWVFALISIPTGLAMLTMITAANAAIQVSTAPHMRGRVMSVYMMVFLGSTPVGSPVIGWIGDQWGARWSIAFGGVLCIVVSIVAAIWAKRTWNVRIQARLSRHPFTMYGPRERAADMRAASQQDN